MSYKASPITELQSYSYQTNNIQYSPIRAAITPFIDETQKLNEVILQKNLQIAKLYQQNLLIRKPYQEQILTYKKTIELLQNKLFEKQSINDVQFLKIKQKFEELSLKQSQNLKSLHTNQIEFLIKQVAQQRSSNESLNLKIILKDKQIQNIKNSYQKQLSSNTTQINSLNRLITKLQQDKNKQIRQLNSKRQLQKSRTNGLISSRKENHQFMDKQVRKLNEEVLEKTIQIQSLSRELTREKKKYQDFIRTNSNLIIQLKQNHALQIQLKIQENVRNQKLLKIQLQQVKINQIKYIDQIQTLKTIINQQQKSIQNLKQIILQRKGQIQSYKSIINKNKEQHANQINNLMKQKRKSKSNIGSSRSIISLKDSGILLSDSPPHSPQKNDSITSSKYESNFQASLKLEKNLRPIRQQTPDRNQQKDYSRQLAGSNFQQQNIQSDLQKAVYHYDNLIEELKRNHNFQIQLLRINQKKMKSKLQEKQQQLLDILTRFSPLVKIHAGQKSLQEDRKQRIERHWKSDVALLDVLLKKYKIRVLQ